MLYTYSFVAMALANFCITSSFSTFFLFPLFIADRGGSEGDIGLVMGVFALASALCRPWISGMIDRIGRKKSFGIGSMAMTLLPLVYLTFRGDLTDF
jgi:MFS family permease